MLLAMGADVSEQIKKSYGHTSVRHVWTDEQGDHTHIDVLVDTLHQLAGEADELAGRDDVDDHMTHIIEGLRFQALDVQQWLNEHYYIDAVELVDPDYDGETET